MRSIKREYTINASVLIPLHTKVAHVCCEMKQDPEQECAITELRPDSMESTACQPRSIRWKRWVIYSLLIALIVPVLIWAGMAAIAPAWMDQEKLAAFRQEIERDAVTIQGQHRVHIEEMPVYVSNALLAIEDHRYRLHPGIDPIGLARSVWINATKQKKAQGGSTITMQLARNLFLTHDKTYSRKLKEIAIAANLEWNYSKQDILEMYFNKVYFGHGRYGIEDAARYYFGKTTVMNGELPTINVEEAAMLVGLLKAPERYSPAKNMDLAVKRQRVVLKRMTDLGMITEAERQQALNTEINVGSNKK
ncbi:transglycosylase domain-containing protein [Paenibacillus sp. MER TA 81-3]|uniref:transglycosylase domain-containing protein n=1 Tax=Paenibacillus sp. MER TA 81-3 TaxID=2939573 RepID=UPI00203CA639|nr:transglycosylase domain-containing protein [Paenibacillus sp. MER TA 81-3]MCM3341952.1 transglycosylase domain-containing protein [Paenibacillus sp. MER TA 81-3]